MSETLDTLLEFAVETAYLAGKLTLGYYQAGVRPDLKSDDTPVTAADRGAEQLIRSRIEQRYPRHAILGEEFGVQESAGATHRWLIDPIDGTKAFVRGVPLYAVLLGLEIEGVVQVGAAYFPALDDMVYAATGRGCWWNGRRARVSSVANLTDAIALVSGLNYFGNKRDAWNRIVDATYFQRTWGDAYGYFLVATGRAELMLDPAMHLWDCAPLQVILEEAGGTFTDWHGRPGIHHGESIATNGVLLEPLLELIAADRPD
jgi:histidinol phosphatase-like enzyme (inositol monophosphatase family)